MSLRKDKRIFDEYETEIAALRDRLAAAEAEVERLRGALQEVILLPGENGPRPGSHADAMAQIAEQALEPSHE